MWRSSTTRISRWVAARPRAVGRRGRRRARRRVVRDGVVPRVGRDIARGPGPGWPGPGRGAVLRIAQREDLLRVPRDRDLDGAARNPRLLLSPGSPRGLWDRRLGLPSVLSALGILFSITFVFLLLPLMLRQTALSSADGLKA